MQRARGFTLVEVLVAVVVMTIGVFGMLALLPQALGTTRTAGRSSALNQLATEKLESLRGLAYTHASLNAGTHPTQGTDSSGAKYYPVTGFPEAYSLRWIVSAGPTNGAGTAEPNVKTIRVEATYFVRYTTGGAEVPGERSVRTVLQTFVTAD